MSGRRGGGVWLPVLLISPHRRRGADGKVAGTEDGFQRDSQCQNTRCVPTCDPGKEGRNPLKTRGKEIIPPVCRCVIPSFRSTVFRYCQARPSRIHPGIKIIINNTDNSQLAQTFPHFFSHTLLLHRPSSASMFRYRQTILRIGAPLGLTGKHAAKSRSAE